MEIKIKIHKYFILGVLFAALSVILVIFLKVMELKNGETHSSLKRLEMYECFQAIRDKDNSEWISIGTRGDALNQDIYSIQRNIMNEDTPGIESLRDYERRNKYRDGLRNMEIQEESRTSPAWLFFHYKNNTGYVRLYEDNRKIAISVSTNQSEQGE